MSQVYGKLERVIFRLILLHSKNKILSVGGQSYEKRFAALLTCFSQTFSEYRDDFDIPKMINLNINTVALSLPPIFDKSEFFGPVAKICRLLLYANSCLRMSENESIMWLVSFTKKVSSKNF